MNLLLWVRKRGWSDDLGGCFVSRLMVWCNIKRVMPFNQGGDVWGSEAQTRTGFSLFISRDISMRLVAFSIWRFVRRWYCEGGYTTNSNE